MMYTTTITKSGQITLPKAVRERLGVDVGDRVTIDDKNRLARELTDEEFRAELDRIGNFKSPEMQKIIKKNAGKTVRELREEWENSPEGKKYWKERMKTHYGVKL